MAAEVYVLQVGINKYPKNVGSLSGCKNDVKNIQGYLDRTFGKSAHVVQLLDSDANRENVIRQFREHLGQASANDVVLFHYSGHGARCKSAPEFQKWFPDGWDEGLVLHDSRQPGGFDLADKELAILLSEVAKKNPHITVLLDCCHSGSATRGLDDFTQLRVRQTHTVNEPRPLESYLGGYYENRLKQGEPLHLPSSKHILLAACQRKQKAWEGRDHQGVFTNSLLEVLGNTEQDLAYANVFLRCREAVRNRATNQDPQFETFAGFTAYSGFLGQSAEAKARRCTVVFDKNQNEWLLNRGAIHGLPTAPDKITTMEIYPAGNETLLGNARTVQVGAQRSELEFDGFDPKPGTNYEAELTSMPGVPMPVALIAHDSKTAKKIVDVTEKNVDQIFDFALETAATTTKYALRVSGKTWQIEHRETDKLVLGAQGDFEKSAEYIFDALNKIAQWERTLQLQNDATKLNPDDVDFQLVEIDKDDVEHPIEGLDFTGNVVQENEKLRFKLVANNTSDQELNFALLYMPEDFSIAIPYNMSADPTEDTFEFVFPTSRNEESPIIYAKVDKDSAETLYILKLLISTEKVDDFLLKREKLKGLGKIKTFSLLRGEGRKKGMSFGNEPQEKITHKNEWFTKTITIRVVMQTDQIKEDEDIELANGTITIKANPSLKAGVAISSAKTGTRGVGESTDFYQAMERAGASLVNFSGTRGEDQSVLELSEIDFDPKDLREHPLEIELDSELADDEYILSVTFDGENMILTGLPSKDDDGRTHISIDHIPETTNNRRSLLSALKLYFFKIVKGDNVNKLSWVEYDQDGEVHRRSSGVAEKVNVANKVLLLVHGIIGDTKGIAEGLPRIDSGGDTLNEKFDVVLTYDYENLNTPIEKTAEILKKQLAEVGLKEEDDIHVTFLVHSMGGLVSRWFIEKLGGNNIVDHLVMCGTPNDGSPFGEVGLVRKVVSTLGTLAINAFPATAPFLGPVLYALNRSKKISPTLEQMNHDSGFMKELGRLGDPSIQYSIVAGDVRNYDASQDKWTARLVAKVGQGFAFNTLYSDDGHDIAVKVDSIRSIADNRNPKPDKQTVTCHHMNYFVADEGLAALSKINW